ncbi:MAG: FixH family protein [Bacteroidia bacterium]|nr:FixH family protein [Bacteroidia bacterium]
MTRRPFHWGQAVWLGLALFGAFMAYFLVLALREDPNAEVDNPYRESLAYPSRQAEVANARRHPLTIGIAEGELRLRGTPPLSGRLVFQRTDGTARDVTTRFALKPDSTYRLHIVGLKPGAWRLQVHYQAGADSCYTEYPFSLPPP